MTVPIPATGFGTYTGRGRPHLQSEAVAACASLRHRGYKVQLQAECLLVALTDAVSSSHGQFYGSWNKFIEKHGYSRSVVFRWLDRLEELGLVEYLGHLGRKTTTYQILPHLYRLDSQNQDTSPLVSWDQDTSEKGYQKADLSHSPDTTSPDPGSSLVSRSEDSLVSGDQDTNTRTPLNTEPEHRLTSSLRDEEEPEEPMEPTSPEDIEAERRRQKTALVEYAKGLPSEDR